MVSTVGDDEQVVNLVPVLRLYRIENLKKNLHGEELVILCARKMTLVAIGVVFRNVTTLNSHDQVLEFPC